MRQLKIWKSIYNCNIVGYNGICFQEATIFAKNTLQFLKNIFFNFVKINDHTFFRLENVFKNYRIFFDLSKYKNITSICLGGYFDEENNKLIVYINRNILNNYKEYLTINDLWNSIEEVLGHELIHKIQFYKRGFKKYNNNDISIKEELSQKDEIMSYAWQCVDLFILYGLNKNEALKAINDYNDSNRFINIILMKYYHYFNNNNKDDQRILKLFKKYVYEYIQKMIIK